MTELRDTIAPHLVTSTIHTALANARKLGEPWKALAEEYLGQTEALLKGLDAHAMKMLKQYVQCTHELETMKKQVLASLDTLADSLWESRGRNPHDPLVAIFSPDTPSFFFDWSIGQPADRVDALLEFLTSCTLTDGVAPDALTELQALLPHYRELGETARGLRARLDVFDKLVETFSRVGHVQYSRLRRRLRVDGYDIFDIRNVFPDIPGQSTMGTLS